MIFDHSVSKAIYREDAKHSATPWEFWEFRHDDAHWPNAGVWQPVEQPPFWTTHTQYRRKADAPSWADHPQEHEFDYCAVSPDNKHSEEWYCNSDCTHCKAGAQDGPLLWVGHESLAQEHESLDAFIEKVEASGEDKKHEAFDKAIFLSMARAAGFWYYDMHDVDGVDLGENLECDKFGATDRLVAALAEYTQQQLDDVVRAERERLLGAIVSKAEQKGWAMRDESSFEDSVQDVVDEVREDHP